MKNKILEKEGNDGFLNRKHKMKKRKRKKKVQLKESKHNINAFV